MKKRAHAFGAVALATALSTLGNAAGASATPAELTPTWASSADAPGGVYGGFEIVGQPGFSLLPTDGSSVSMEIPAPSPGSGYAVPRALRGPVQVSSTLTVPGDDSAAQLYTGGYIDPFGYRPENDQFLSGNAIRTLWNGHWEHTYDFSSLPDGVLPAGARIFIGDLDLAMGEGEKITLTSDKAGEWLRYDYDQISAGYAAPAVYPLVQFDADTSEYSSTGRGPNVDLASWFTTAEDVTTLTITSVHGDTGSRGALTFGLLAPLEPAAPSIALTKNVREIVDVNDNGYTDTGDEIYWSFDITNTGNVAVQQLSIADVMLNEHEITVSCAPTEVLEVGATASCVSNEPYAITQDDAAAGQVENVATAHAVYSDGPVDSNPDNTLTPVKTPVVPTDPPDPSTPETPTDPGLPAPPTEAATVPQKAVPKLATTGVELAPLIIGLSLATLGLLSGATSILAMRRKH